MTAMMWKALIHSYTASSVLRQRAAILFSDILVVPYSLGQLVRFTEGEGPRLDALADPSALTRLRPMIDQSTLAPIYEAIARVREELPTAAALLGFCGGPWTVAAATSST